MADHTRSGVAGSRAVPDAAATRFLDIRKSDGERLRVELREHRGRVYVDFRNWFLAPDNEWRPSAKGLTLRPEQIPEVVRALVLAGAAIDPQRGR
jgi:Transcriptional Coactivator p15 (PC4)